MVGPLKAGAVVFAKDLARMVAFYQAVCGLSVVESEPTHVLLGSDAVDLTIHAIPAEIAEDIVITSPPERREDTAVKLVLPVVSIADARGAATSLGGVIDADDRVWEFRGMNVCDGHDPEGNVIQVREWVGAL